MFFLGHYDHHLSVYWLLSTCFPICLLVTVITVAHFPHSILSHFGNNGCLISNREGQVQALISSQLSFLPAEMTPVKFDQLELMELMELMLPS